MERADVAPSVSREFLKCKRPGIENRCRRVIKNVELLVIVTCENGLEELCDRMHPEIGRHIAEAKRPLLVAIIVVREPIGKQRCFIGLREAAMLLEDFLW